MCQNENRVSLHNLTLHLGGGSLDQITASQVPKYLSSLILSGSTKPIEPIRAAYPWTQTENVVSGFN